VEVGILKIARRLNRSWIHNIYHILHVRAVGL